MLYDGDLAATEKRKQRGREEPGSGVTTRMFLTSLRPDELLGCAEGVGKGGRGDGN